MQTYWRCAGLTGLLLCFLLSNRDSERPKCRKEIEKPLAVARCDTWNGSKAENSHLTRLASSGSQQVRRS